MLPTAETAKSDGPAAAPGDEQLKEIERVAVEAADEAGRMVAGRFGGPMDVESKGGDTRNPVTDVDHASQALILEHMRARFPEHMFLGEEDQPSEGSEQEPARDLVWCVDPIDGTANFVNGHPVFAVSVGVLHRGSPVVAAAWVPWPNEDGHIVIHARKGGGAWIGSRQMSVLRPQEGNRPQNGWLAAIPGSLNRMFKVKRDVRGSLGEPRITGSVVYELSMVAAGILQYAVTGPAYSWDMAAGSLLVKEAGGIALTPAGPADRVVGDWKLLETFDADYDNTPETARRLRNWRGVVLAGAPEIAWFVSQRLEPRNAGRWTRIIGRLL